ncbi:hypothetical protein F5Y17DRAFT_461444 [Xylariaceae sp. FL0594]|nr:hypothetical protein F5Y17DRAFT_461444 [Xylariaceae sp. FL0594]
MTTKWDALWKANDSDSYGVSERLLVLDDECQDSTCKRTVLARIANVYLVLLHALLLASTFLRWGARSKTADRDVVGKPSWLPVTSSIQYALREPVSYRIFGNETFAGPLSLEQDLAWDRLIKPAYFNATLEELAKAGEDLDNLTELAGGGYLSSISVYHELHCLQTAKVTNHYFGLPDYFQQGKQGKMEGRIRIAIVGGGLAGAAIANGLLPNPLFDVHVYESAADFSGRTGIIELSHIALQALEGVIPSAVKFLKSNVGAAAMDVAHIVTGSGPNAGTLIRDLGVRGLIMDRPLLLRQLTSRIPRASLHAGKKLVHLEETASDSIKLLFQNGEHAECHAVVSADGTFSRVRGFVLRQVALESKASPAGWWECMASVAPESARAALAGMPEPCDLGREYQWVGDGIYMMHAMTEDHTDVQCNAVVVEEDGYPPMRGVQPITRDILKDRVSAGRLEHPMAQRMTQMALEDAFILASLLNRISSVADIGTAFKAFSGVRKPRCQRIIDTSRATGDLCCPRRGKARVGTEELEQLLLPLSAHIKALKLEEHEADAVCEYQNRSVSPPNYRISS